MYSKIESSSSTPALSIGVPELFGPGKKVMLGSVRHPLVMVLTVESQVDSLPVATSRMSLPLCSVLPPPVPWPDQSSFMVRFGSGAFGQLHGGLLPVALGHVVLTSCIVISAPPASWPVNSAYWQVMKLPTPPPEPSTLTLFGDHTDAITLLPFDCESGLATIWPLPRPWTKPLAINGTLADGTNGL